MKQILFRGKTESGRWVYGSLILSGKYCCILEEDREDIWSDVFLDSETGVIDGYATPVIPETVGRLLECPTYDPYVGEQYFEGDIVEFRPRKGEKSQARIVILVDNNSVSKDGLGRWFPQDCFEVAKVIGNVHDNPELVGENYADLYKYYHCLEVTCDEQKTNN